MKISKKTLAAAQKAADDQGVSLDTWAERALASAAAARRSPDAMTLLGAISDKIDQIAKRQGLAEKANEQLAVAIEEAGKSYAQVRRTTGQFLGDVMTKTSSALEEVRGRTQELITGRPSEDGAGAEETAPRRTKRKPTRKKPTAKSRAAATKTARRKTTRAVRRK